MDSTILRGGIATLFTIFCSASLSAQVFVDSDPAIPGPRDGTSWGSAYASVQEGLVAALGGGEVRVAGNGILSTSPLPSIPLISRLSGRNECGR